MNEGTNTNGFAVPHPRTWDTLALVNALKRAEKRLLYHRKAEHEIEFLCAWIEAELERRARCACNVHNIPYVKKTPKSLGTLADNA